jgi:hypothetical protein
MYHEALNALKRVSAKWFNYNDRSHGKAHQAQRSKSKIRLIS